MPWDYSDKWTEELQPHVLPSERERQEARAWLIRQLSDGEIYSLRELDDLALSHQGLPPASGLGREQVDILVHSDGTAVFDPDTPALRGQRVITAAREALWDLLSIGSVVEIGISGNNPEFRVPYQEPGLGASSAVRLNRPEPSGGGFRLHHRILADPRLRALDPNELVQGLDDLLGVRGLGYLREAAACFRSGQYLAAASMLAAASEAAWYEVGRSLESEDQTIGTALSNDRTSQLITKCCDVFNRNGKIRSAVVSVRSHAHLLREVRNYALHPGGTSNDVLEDYFTEPGCIALFLSTRQYLLQVADMKQAMANPTE